MTLEQKFALVTFLDGKIIVAVDTPLHLLKPAKTYYVYLETPSELIEQTKSNYICIQKEDNFVTAMAHATAIFNDLLERLK